MIVTIDGPTASGKSSTAKLLARRLGFYYLNSGLLYRAVAYLLMHDKGYTAEQLRVPEKQDLQDIIDVGRLSYTSDKDTSPRITFDGADITSYLKSIEIDRAVPIVSANPQVRQLLLNVQRAIGAQHDLVIDGRDTGTVVFPQAEFKFYLTAPLDIRARRWMRDQQAHGVSISFDEACKQVAQRDERDMTREIAPLRIPEDATVLDNGSVSLDETVDILYKKIHAKNL
jgi:cytidylate kinase